jgi:hypothetical protein
MTLRLSGVYSNQLSYKLKKNTHFSNKLIDLIKYLTKKNSRDEYALSRA